MTTSSITKWTPLPLCMRLAILLLRVLVIFCCTVRNAVKPVRECRSLLCVLARLPPPAIFHPLAHHGSLVTNLPIFKANPTSSKIKMIPRPVVKRRALRPSHHCELGFISLRFFWTTNLEEIVSPWATDSWRTWEVNLRLEVWDFPPFTDHSSRVAKPPFSKLIQRPQR